MNVLVVTASNFILDKLIDMLIPNGVAVYHVEHRINFAETIIKNNIDCVLLDYTAESFNEALRLIREVTTNRYDEVRRAAMVLYVEGEGLPHDIINRGLDAGAVSFLRMNTPADVLIRHLVLCCEKVQGTPPPIKYALVKLAKEFTPENVPVKFHSPVSGHALLGTVVEISAGGMEVEIMGHFDPESLSIKMVLKEIEFNLLEHKLVVDGLIVAKNKNIVTILFVNISEADRHELSHYIYMKLSGLI